MKQDLPTGQGGGENPTQAVTSPTAPEVAAPAPRSARRIPKWLLISMIGLVVLVALGAAGYVTLGRSLAAKEAAAVSMAAAKVAVQEASTAAEPGSQALDESQKSEAALDEARLLYSEGYLVRIGRYRAAASRADEARKIARAVTAEVEALAADASIADSNEAVGLYFALYEKYPRTHEGRAALPRASEVLLADLSSDDCDCLISIKEFCADCPGTVPESVYAAAGDRVESMARDTLGWQTSMVASNKRWVKKLRSPKGASFGIWGTSKSDTDELSQAIAALPTVEASRYRPVLVLLRDCSKLGERCTKVANSPTRSTKKWEYFSSRQISTVDKLTRQMDAKLNKARRELKRL